MRFVVSDNKRALFTRGGSRGGGRLSLSPSGSRQSSQPRISSPRPTLLALRTLSTRQFVNLGARIINPTALLGERTTDEGDIGRSDSQSDTCPHLISLVLSPRFRSSPARSHTFQSKRASAEAAEKESEGALTFSSQNRPPPPSRPASQSCSSCPSLPISAFAYSFSSSSAALQCRIIDRFSLLSLSPSLRARAEALPPSPLPPPAPVPSVG